MTTQEQIDLNIALAILRAENLRLTQAAAKAPSHGIKVSSKGGVSVYGLGRFPVTLYSSQWQSLFEKQDAIKKFLVDNAASLKTKETEVQ